MGVTMDALLAGLWSILSPSTFGLMLLGVLVGFFVGLLPGLGGPTTIALMLPFVIKMNSVEAFAFLLGMAAVCSTTGDITSILFGVPGEPTTAATILDGHPMARKGEAGRAIGAALMSSLVGAIFGAVALAVAVPFVRPLVLTFGIPEFFMLAMLGLIFVACLSGEAKIKGFIGAGIGLFLATVGQAPISGIQRYTFGQLFLWDGVGLVPITIGFFAIPEIIELVVLGSSIAVKRITEYGGVMEGIKDTFRHWWLVIRCSAIGTFTSIIPGIGGATTQWLAYGHAVQSSPDKTGFGKGRVEGVLGPGAANNSTLGGSLITTIAFGVPTSVLMAILLGAFIMQGLVPGPDMLIAEPKGHLSLTFSFVWTMVLSNIITVGICLIFSKQIAKLTYIRGNVLVPPILLLIYLGAFAEKNVFEDIYLVLIFGGLGWVMQRLNWPRPPLILALVLGPLTENKLFLSTELYGVTWLFRPWVLLLLAIGLAGILYPVLFSRRRQKKLEEKGQPALREGGSRIKEKSKKLGWDVLFDFVIIVTFICALWASRGFGFEAGLFPWVISSVVLVLALIQLVRDYFYPVAVTHSDGDGGGEAMSILGHVANRRTAMAFGWIIACPVTIWLLGFSVGAFVFTLTKLKIFDREKLALSFSMAACSWALIYGLFDRVLKIPFPTGWLFSLF